MRDGVNIEIIEHTADLGLKISAPTLSDLFVKAASGILEYAVGEKRENLLRQPDLSIEERVFVAEEDSWEELFLRWLNEQLFNLYTYNILAVDYSLLVKESQKKRLSAKTRYIKIKPEYIASEVKAATRHNLKIERTPLGFKAEVIFDL